jgi:DNA-3-methyladenine glycosylase II
MSSPLTPEQIAKTIVKRDRAFAPVIKRAGPPPIRRNATAKKRFVSLIEAITSQLVSVKAADTIFARVKEACGGQVTPESISAAGFETLRSAGLSATKAQAMIDLAQRSLDGRVKLARHPKMTSAEVTNELTSVRGIGPWTAEMYLLFSLARHDVWPHLDFGVRAGWSIIHDLPEMISIKELKDAGANFAGVESETAWYCWRALEHERERGG